jgi:hypothetical protein
MMQKLLLVFLFCLLWSACSSPKKPEGVLTQAQLSALFLDIYLAEARLEAMPMIRDSSVRYFVPFEEKLLKSKGISDSTIKKTYAYYLSHPKELEQVYDAVIDTLVLHDQRLVHGPIPKKPSLKNPE